MTDTEKKWVEVGYQFFAKGGPKGLKIDLIAKSLNTSRSSFYHHFADLEIYTSLLFEYHLERSELMCEAAIQCNRMNPDLLNAMLEFKQDILFNRQLRVNRHLPEYAKCIEQAHAPIERAFLTIWAKEVHLESDLTTAQMFLKLVADNFYMRISEENLHFDWLENYLKEIVQMRKRIEQS